MNAGSLRQRVTIQLLAELPDSYGQQIESFTTVGTYWASITTLGGTKVPLGTQVQLQFVYRVEMRYTGPSLSIQQLATLRLQWKGRNFNVVHAENVNERNRTFLFTCREIVSPSQ